MGGKGSSGGQQIPKRPQGQQSDRSAGPSGGGRRDELGRLQTGRDRRKPDYQPQQMPSQPRSRPREEGLRIGAEQITRLYSPQQKPNPQAPMPARVGVRQERRPYNPELAISAAEQAQLQKNIDFERGYGPSFAIDPTLLGSDNDEDALGESGSFLGDPSRW